MKRSVVALTQELIRLDTVAAGEDVALAVVAPLLEQAGFELARVAWKPGRSNLIATWRGGGPLVLSGHLDTVPVGARAWTHEPFGAELADGRLWGRGASDMKGGVAALVAAAIEGVRGGAEGFTVALTSGEETGCHGASVVRAAGLLPPDSFFVLGEATGNEVRFGHKGATWLRLTARGKAAHGSRPDLGVNAIEALVRGIEMVNKLGAGEEHRQLGKRTINIGTIAGGTQTNLVPDVAAMTVDVRTVPGAGAESVRDLLSSLGDVEEMLDLNATWSDPTAQLSERIVDAVASVTGSRPEPSGVSYFTDASVLDASSARTYVVGPGDIDQPHTTDESVSVDLLEQSVDVYRAIIAGAARM